MQFLVVLAEAESEARQRIELPVEVPGLLRIILVGKHVGVQLHTEQYAVREKGIDAQTHTSDCEGLAVRPYMLKRVALIVQGVRLVIVESAIHSDSCEQIRIDRAAVIALLEQIGQIERHIDVAL